MIIIVFYFFWVMPLPWYKTYPYWIQNQLHKITFM